MRMGVGNMVISFGMSGGIVNSVSRVAETFESERSIAGNGVCEWVSGEGGGGGPWLGGGVAHGGGGGGGGGTLT